MANQDLISFQELCTYNSKLILKIEQCNSELDELKQKITRLENMINKLEDDSSINYKHSTTKYDCNNIENHS